MGGSGVAGRSSSAEQEARAGAQALLRGEPVEVTQPLDAELHLDGDADGGGGDAPPAGTGVPPSGPADSGDGGEPPADAAPSEGGTDPVLRSEHPEVDGRTVSQAGADVQARAGRYHDAVPRFRSISESSRQQEVDWYDDLGLIGGFIDLFNDVEQTNPNRWDVVIARWGEAEASFGRVLAIRVTPDTINPLGETAADAMEVFEDAWRQDQVARAEFQAYLQGFQGSAGDVLQVTELVRDISFAAAVGIAVVVAAPGVPAEGGTVPAQVPSEGRQVPRGEGQLQDPGPDPVGQWMPRTRWSMRGSRTVMKLRT